MHYCNQGSYLSPETATLTELSEGLHTIIVFATDTFGQTGVSQTVTFTIVEVTASPKQPLPATAIAIISAIIFVDIIVLLVGIRKKTSEKNKLNN